MMSRTMHVHLSVSGSLSQGHTEMARLRTALRRSDGTKFASVRELREVLVELLAGGVECIPIGSPCEGFDPKTGCPGHDTAEVDLT